MSDYIKREDALKPEIELLPDISGLKTNHYEVFLVEQVIQIYKNYLKNIPAADVVERKRGGWVQVMGKYDWMYVCSKCGFVPIEVDRAKYCPNCGARMVTDDV